jgi:hypothetical protein
MSDEFTVGTVNFKIKDNQIIQTYSDKIEALKAFYAMEQNFKKLKLI